jgi:uncharacterized protein (TIGR02996 family)
VSAYDHPDWQAFVAAVREAPDEDTPRLVAADWLDEHGEHARAELVRVQCALARLVFGPLTGWALRPGESYAALHSRLLCECDSCQTAKPLRGREAELLGGPNPRPFAANVWAIYARGFCEHVRLPWEEWRDRGDQLLRREPVRAVDLLTPPSGHWIDANGVLTFWFTRGTTVVRKVREADVFARTGGGPHTMKDVLETAYPGVAFTLPPEPV